MKQIRIGNFEIALLLVLGSTALCICYAVVMGVRHLLRLAGLLT